MSLADHANDQGHSSISMGSAWFICMVVWLFSHFLAAPKIDYVLDDWSNLKDSARSPSELWSKAWTHPGRPVSMVFIFGGFHAWGEHPVVFRWVSIVAHGLVLYGLMAWCMVFFTGRREVALAAGCLLALVPTLSENIHWATMVIGAAVPALVCYALFLWQGARSILQRHPASAIIASCCYGCAIFSYEAGILLPAAFGVFLCRSTCRNAVLRLWLACAVPLLAAVIWRMTGAFGNTTYELAPQFKPEFSLGFILYNARQIASWWIGPSMWNQLSSGLGGWRWIGQGAAAGLMLANVLLCVGAWMLLRRTTLPSISSGQLQRDPLVFLFFPLAAALAHAPSLFSYTASRLIYLPALCIAPMLGYFACHLFARKLWRIPLLLVGLMLLIVNQGTARNWWLAGEICRNTRIHLEQVTQPAMATVPQGVVFFASDGLKQLIGYQRTDDVSAEKYVHALGNAGLVRGFATFTMFPSMAQHHRVLDVEHPHQFQENHLRWKPRYANPDGPEPWTETPLEQVYVLDLFEVGVPPSIKRTLSAHPSVP